MYKKVKIYISLICVASLFFNLSADCKGKSAKFAQLSAFQGCHYIPSTSGKEVKVKKRNMDASAAENVAKRILGFDAEVSNITLSKDTKTLGGNVPFLAAQIMKRASWSVTFNQVSINLISAAPGFRDRKTRSVTVTLDAKTGQPLFVHATTHESDLNMYPEPPAASAETQLQNQGEIYVGFPEGQPLISYLAALNSVLTNGIGSPFSAKEIDGMYVLMSQKEKPAFPAWVITLRGIPPLPHHGPPGATVQEWEVNHIRNIVDAKTGKVLYATSAPQPDVPMVTLPE